ncbi:hypothetical protein EDC04DRAFT_2610297 [Pisolithus marmoratus]|nr:hypothetical protein EDC04DRAFT_2610297 [Pisolithus marmoratus]
MSCHAVVVSSDEHSNNNTNNNNNRSNDNGGNGISNNSDAPAPAPITSHGVEQSGHNARAFKKGPSNSFKLVVRVFNCSLTHKVPSMEQPSQQVQKPGPSQNQAAGALSHTQGHSHHAVEADKENFESELSELSCKPWQKASFHPVTILIILEIKQHTYDWHSELATHALKVVEAFFNHLLPLLCSHICMWERVDEGPDGPIPKGTFQHDCILNTFTLYLESTSIIKPSARENPTCFPQGALTLVTIAVERVFQVWSTGQYVPPPKGQQRFSQALWGYATNKVTESVDCLSAKLWKRILLSAENTSNLESDIMLICLSVETAWL